MNTTDIDIINDCIRDEEKEDMDEICFCTLAVTGTNPTFQAIFLCNEASNSDGITTTAKAGQSQSSLCVCQACAEVCHDDGRYDVEYIGMGPSYCDCSRLGNCKLHKRSMQEAERLGILAIDKERFRQQKTSLPTTQSSPEDYIREAFDMPLLQHCKNSDATIISLLIEQARELVRHTKETHWIDEAVINTNSENDALSQKGLCWLESLACSIYRSHRERYRNTIFLDADDKDGKISQGGAEWWIQVKDISNSNSFVEDDVGDENDTLDINKNNGNSLPSLASSSIDLHYDKDEALAESFGIGSFPTLSTVTYLTAEATIAAPTVVFDHTYTQGEDEVMSSMMVSRPRVGKHICFDGKLLHGAPYHPLLLSSSSIPVTRDGCEGTGPRRNPHNGISRKASEVQQFRVTFLVNIWKDRRPANVHVLDDKIRNIISSMPQLESIVEEKENLSLLVQPGFVMPMIPLSISRVAYNEEDDLQDRIELPFVSNLGEDDDDEEAVEQSRSGNTVVVTFPPPLTEDCVLVSFGPGMEAYIDYNSGGPEEDESGDESIDDNAA